MRGCVGCATAPCSGHVQTCYLPHSKMSLLPTFFDLFLPHASGTPAIDRHTLAPEPDDAYWRMRRWRANSLAFSILVRMGLASHEKGSISGPDSVWGDFFQARKSALFREDPGIGQGSLTNMLM